MKCPDCNGQLAPAGITHIREYNIYDISKKENQIPVFICENCDIIYCYEDPELLIMYICAEPLPGKIIEISKENLIIQLNMKLFEEKHQNLFNRISNGDSKIKFIMETKNFYKATYENEDIETIGKYDDGKIVIGRDLVEDGIFQTDDIVHIEIQQSHLPKVMYLIHYENDPKTNPDYNGLLS